MDNLKATPNNKKPELSFADKMKIKAVRNIGIPILQDILPALTPMIAHFINTKKLQPGEVQAIIYMFVQNNNVFIAVGYIDENNTIKRYEDVMPFSDFVIKMMSEIQKL